MLRDEFMSSRTGTWLYPRPLLAKSSGIYLNIRFWPHSWQPPFVLRKFYTPRSPKTSEFWAERQIQEQLKKKLLHGRFRHLLGQDGIGTWASKQIEKTLVFGVLHLTKWMWNCRPPQQGMPESDRVTSVPDIQGAKRGYPVGRRCKCTLH